MLPFLSPYYRTIRCSERSVHASFRTVTAAGQWSSTAIVSTFTAAKFLKAIACTSESSATVYFVFFSPKVLHPVGVIKILERRLSWYLQISRATKSASLCK